MTENEARETVRLWCRSESCCDENLFVRRLREHGLSDAQILAVVEAIGDICNYCWNRDGVCHCENDE